MYSLKTKDLELKLEIIEVKALCQHEQTLTPMIDKLVIEFKNWASLNNPVIVDENNVVLDGNHRAMVFKKLDFKYIAVCKIDYFNPHVLLKYWYRHVKMFKDHSILIDFLNKKNTIIAEKGTYQELRDELIKDPLALGMQLDGKCYLVKYPEKQTSNAIQAYKNVKNIENFLETLNYSWDYIPCQFMLDSEFFKKLSKKDLILITPHITKKMVVDASLDGKVFSPKTTRHVIPARPLNVKVPIRWFNETVSLEKINKRFASFLQSKNVRRFPPGQVIDGRFYG